MSGYPGAVAAQQQQRHQLTNQQYEGLPAPPVQEQLAMQQQFAYASPPGQAVEMQPLQWQQPPGGAPMQSPPVYSENPPPQMQQQQPYVQTPAYAQSPMQQQQQQQQPGAPPRYMSPQQPQPYGSPPVYGQQPQYVLQQQPQYVMQNGQLLQLQPGQTVLVVGGCPAGGGHSMTEDFTPLGICLAICFFPIGMICCCAMKERRCVKCNSVME
jgi:hypothetical protein